MAKASSLDKIRALGGLRQGVPEAVHAAIRLQRYGKFLWLRVTEIAHAPKRARDALAHKSC